MIRSLFSRAAWIALAVLSASLFFVAPAWTPIPAAYAAPLQVALACVVLAAVAATLASAYRPALFSRRNCSGTPFDDSRFRLSQ